MPPLAKRSPSAAGPLAGSGSAPHDAPEDFASTARNLRVDYY